MRKFKLGDIVYYYKKEFVCSVIGISYNSVFETTYKLRSHDYNKGRSVIYICRNECQLEPILSFIRNEKIDKLLDSY